MVIFAVAFDLDVAFGFTYSCGGITYYSYYYSCGVSSLTISSSISIVSGCSSSSSDMFDQLLYILFVHIVNNYYMVWNIKLNQWINPNMFCYVEHIFQH